MKQVTLHISEEKFLLFIELAKSINFIKKIEVEDEASTKEQDLKQAVKEMNLIKTGRLKARDARELINEL